MAKTAVRAGRMVPEAWARLGNALATSGPPLTFGVRLWASVSLALYVAFWLQLDNAYWAGTSAALVCQPLLGASLRKGWFRMIGTMIGAVAIVLLAACFPQNRMAILIGLAVWGGACAFAATVLRNFAGYAAALSGYSAAIIAGDQFGPTGGVNGDIFMLAVTRVSEIAIGIVCAGVVLAGTDLGGARRRLASLLADLAAAITTGVTRTLATAGPAFRDTQAVRRDFIGRVIALDPVIDQTVGESSTMRYHSPVLQNAVDGLFGALSAWRAITNHVLWLPHSQAQADAAAVLQHLSPALRLPLEQGSAASWMADPIRLRRECEAAATALFAWPAGTPSQRLLADKEAEALSGMSDALSGLALLVRDPARPVSRRRGNVRLRVPDWLPALVNAGRAFVTIAVVSLFWIVTAWPSGATAIIWAAISVILMSPRADQAYVAAVRYAVGNALAAVFAAVLSFAVFPQLHTFAGFSIALGAYFVPVGALMAQPWQAAVFIPMVGNIVPLIAPANQMSYDPGQFYNAAMALVGGSIVAALAFRVLPPLSPGFRARWLLALTRRDLRRLARGHTSGDWEGHVHGRLSAMPQQATPLQLAQLLVALSVGTEIIRLRHVIGWLGGSANLGPALEAIAQGNSASAAARLHLLDAELSAREDTGLAPQTVLRARGAILAIAEVLTRHAAYFDDKQTR